MVMPSAQLLVDKATKKIEPLPKSGKDKIKFIIEQSFEVIFVQPLKVYRALKCVYQPDNQQFIEKHDDIKVCFLASTRMQSL